MAVDKNLAQKIADTDLGLLDDMFRAYMSQHSWYRKYANTIKTAILGVITLLGVVVSLGVSLPVPVVVGVAAVGLLAQLFGVDDPEKAVQKAINAGGGRHRA